MFGRRRDGSLIEEGFITATIVVKISERKRISGFAQFFSEQRTQKKHTPFGVCFLLLYLFC